MTLRNALAGIVGLLSIGVLFGWTLGLPTVVQLRPDWAPMQFNTALCFIFLSGGVVACQRGAQGWRSQIFGLLALALAGVSLLQYPLDLNLGIDTLFVDPFTTTRTSHIGRMSPDTAVAFVFSSLAVIILIGSRSLSATLGAGCLALNTLALTFAVALGYLLDLDGRLLWHDTTGMAAHTALFHGLLGLAILQEVRHRLGADRDARHVLTTFGVLVVGSMISVLVFTAVQVGHAAQQRSALTHETALRRLAVQRELEGILQVLSATERFFASSSEVTQGDFDTFVTPYIAEGSPILAIDWSPRVPQAERAAVEMRIQEAGGVGLQALDAGRALTPHPGADFYFPVTYVAPRSYDPIVLGFDHYSDDLRTRTMDEAARTNTARASPIFQLFREGNGDLPPEDLLLLQPTFVSPWEVGGVAVDSAADPRVKGFVVLVIRLSRLVRTALKRIPRDDFWVTLSDLSPEGMRRGEPILVAGLGPGPMPTDSALRGQHEQVNIQGRALRLSFYPSEAFWAKQPPSYGRAFVLFSLLATVGLALYLHSARRGQLRLHEQALRLGAALEGAQLGLWTWAPQTDQASLGERWCRMLGYDPDELPQTGETVWGLIHPEDRARAREAILGSEGAETYRTEYRMRTRGGEWVWVLSAGKIGRRDDDGRPTHVVGIHLDITQSRRLVDELRDATIQAQRATHAKSEFLATMSHEIRTPLHAILGMADLLRETPLTATQSDYITRLDRAGDHLLHLINHILDLSKIEAGHLELLNEPFDLVKLVNTVYGLLALRAESKGLSLTCRIDPETPPNLRGDPSRLQQILVNLIGNAIKFTERGEITLQVGPDPANGAPGALRFAVQDTGIGVPEAHRESIFESFRQVDGSHARNHGGTGLGLNIARRLVRMMGGDLWLETELGVGSTFHFTALFEIAPEPPVESLEPAVKAWGDVKILAVDDQSTNRLILRDTLRRLGIEPELAASMKEGLARWTELQAAGMPFDVVLVDTHMIGGSGFDLIQAIRLTLKGPGPGFAMLSSDRRKGDIDRCNQLGIHAFSLKPLTSARIVQAVEDALAARRSRALANARRAGAQLLIAEDNEDNQVLIRAYLQDTPHHITLVSNGEEAVAAFKSGRFDLVFMDMQMPLLDGYAATRLCRAWERETGRAPTPIIALTANALAEDKARSLESGCTAHLNKPMRRTELVATLELYLSSEGEGQRPQSAIEEALPPEGQGAPSPDAEGVIAVHISKKLAPLIPGYLTNQRARVERMGEELERGAWEEIQLSGHGIKGSGGSYGFDGLTEIGAAIEAAAKAQDRAAVEGGMAAVSDYLDRLEITYV